MPWSKKWRTWAWSKELNCQWTVDNRSKPSTQMICPLRYWKKKNGWDTWSISLKIYVVSGLEINWIKSSGYWKGVRGAYKPGWIDLLGVTWENKDNISRLPGTMFGLNLQSTDVDTFQQKCVNKRLHYWSTAKLNNAGRAVIMNSVLLSCIIVFVLNWEGIQKGIKKIKATLKNYHWSCKTMTSRVKVA